MNKRWMFVVLFGLMLVACSKRPSPYPGSPEYLAQFGIVAGQANEIEVAGVKFRFPPQYPLSATANGPIRKGHADKVFFTLDFSKAIDGTGPVVPGKDPHIPSTATQSEPGFNAWARVEIGHDIAEWPDRNEKPPLWQKDPWKDAGEQWGLHQYVMGNGTKYYASVSERTPKGGPVYFFCSREYQCDGAFEHPIGVLITYYVHPSEIANWHLIYTTIFNVIDSSIVEEGPCIPPWPTDCRRPSPQLKY